MAKSTVAILHYSCPPVIGGVEFVIAAHARLFAEAGHNTRLVVGRGESVHPKVRTVVVPELASDGGPVAGVVKALLGGHVPADFDAAVRRTEHALAKALRGVDVCMMQNVLTMHFNLVLTAALANLMRRAHRTRFIGWTHDSTFADPNYAAHQRDAYPWNLLTQALPGGDYCVISAQRQSEISKIFGVPPATLPIIPDGVDVSELLGLTPPIAALFRDEALAQTDIVALTPTRIVRRKNLEAGIEIVAAMKAQGHTVRWMVTGAPDPHNADAVDYFRKLTALRRKLGVQRNVLFLCERFNARISNDDLRGLFAVSDMLIFPSLREGFGIPVLEGGMARLVMVLNDIPALREIGGRDAVYIRRRDTPAQVARRAAKALAQSPRLVCRKRLIGHYSWDAVFTDVILPAVTKPKTLWGRR